MHEKKMNDTCKELRKSVLDMMHYSKSSHIGSCFSIIEILYTLYFEILNTRPANLNDPNRDIFILSKAHASAALYATLAFKGFFPRGWLKRYYIDDGILPGHLDRDAVPGVECSCGSLGHGLPIGLGMAIAKKTKNASGKVFVLLGDGECNEGSVWEAVMFASTRKIDNLVAIIDFNHLQGMGADVIDQANLSERFSAFGWHTEVVDGHSIEALSGALLSGSPGKPLVIIANTVKGKGISFMEGKLEWHYKSPNDQEYEQALRELEKS
jgi:transketolase